MSPFHSTTMYELSTNCNVNDTAHYSQMYITLYQVYYATCICVIALVGLTGNALVIKYICEGKHDAQSACSYFIFSLACSDACQGIVYPLYNLIHITHSQIATEVGCRWIIFFICTPQNISAYTLVGLTIVRFIAVYKPHKYYQCLFIPCYRRFLLISIIAIWVWGILVSSIMYLILYDESESVGTMCRYEMQYSFPHAVTAFTVLTIVPTVIMTSFYIAMVYLYRRYAHGCSGLRQHSGNTEKSSSESEIHMAQSAGLLIGIYITTWSPLWIYIILYTVCLDNNDHCLAYCEYEKDMPFLRASVRIIAFLNSAVNVFIYAGRNANFRRAAKADLNKILACLCFCKHCAWKCVCVCHVKVHPSVDSPVHVHGSDTPV